MDEQMKKDLGTVITATVKEDSNGASAAFHNYLRTKIQSILLGEKDEEYEEYEEEDKDDKKDDDKKDDKKKPPFSKKSKKDKDEDDE